MIKSKNITTPLPSTQTEMDIKHKFISCLHSEYRHKLAKTEIPPQIVILLLQDGNLTATLYKCQQPWFYTGV